MSVLDGLAWWRHTIFGALVGFRQDLLRLRGGIVAPCVALLGEKIFGSTLHSIWVGSVRHGSWLPDSGKNDAVCGKGGPIMASVSVRKADPAGRPGRQSHRTLRADTAGGEAVTQHLRFDATDSKSGLD
jgi:hypothetical protein